jgi:hypothetical protein
MKQLILLLLLSVVGCAQDPIVALQKMNAVIRQGQRWTCHLDFHGQARHR